MPLYGEYEASPSDWVRNQVETYESSEGRQGNTLGESNLPVVIVTSLGSRSGKIRKTPLMRVEHSGQYALVASKGGSKDHPLWYHNLKASPGLIMIQDGSRVLDYRVEEVSGEERELWWARAVEAFPPYDEYATKTSRLIPVFVAMPLDQ
ncbi:nitroreductase family deazaflavin-dependent oxidoreductase [Acidithrix ferrooxidans]|uniref:Putative nitroreductase n=1 Tax=Acidithrix ferrooxidans TaxID=1280514 RepID=A0A0D8HHP9_9ACTN|nr:nitroreductase family deazaflavin-dependent oxidoreductase [Acidithrix ferrooxidans]KJF17515.1 putative nitroreductase [Acidithrix ferrooxidans]